MSHERHSRAQRRHDTQRLKKNRVNFWGGKRTSYVSQSPQEQKRLGMLVHTPKLCSCWMCGNPRRHHQEVTMQERRAKLDKACYDQGEDE